MAKSSNGVYLVLVEVNRLLTDIRRNNRRTSNSYHSENKNELISNMENLKNLLNEITDLKSISTSDFLHPFLAIIRSEKTAGPITGLALTSINKFLSYQLIDHGTEHSVSMAVEHIADAVTHARFVGDNPSSDEVILLDILYVLRSLMLSPSGAFLSDDSVCEIISSCFRICLECRLSELLRKSAEHTLVDMVKLVFSRLSEFKDDHRQSPLRKLKMRTGSGFVECSKTSRLRKKSPKVKVKGRHDNRLYASKETINMQDSSSFKPPHHAQPGSATTQKSNNVNKTNTNRHKKNNNNNNNNNNDNDENELNTSVEFDPSNQETKNQDNNNNNTQDNDNNNNNQGNTYDSINCVTKNNENDDNNSDVTTNNTDDNNNTDVSSNSFVTSSNRAAFVPDTLNLSTEYHHQHQRAQDDYQEEMTPASEGPEENVEATKENFIWVDNICTPPGNTSPSDPSLDSPLVDERADKEKEGGGKGMEERVSEEDTKGEEFVNRKGVTFMHDEAGLDLMGCSNHQDETIPLEPYGIFCVTEIFRFLISFTNPYDKNNSETMIQLGLSLLTVSLEAGADDIRQCKSLLSWVKDDMCKHLFFLLRHERTSLYAAAIRVCFLLFESMRGHLKLQLEMYVSKLMEIVISESPRVSHLQKEIALESVVQLLQVPGFISELYLNYDCSLYSSYLFEDLTKLLSKNAFPVTGLVSTNLLSLDALLAIINTIVANCQHRIVKENAHRDCRSADDKRSDFGSMDNLPRLKGNSTASSGAMTSQAAVMMTSSTTTSGSASPSLMMSVTGAPRMRHNRMKVSKVTPTSEELARVKYNKKVYQTGTEQFNQKPSEGISYLQKHGLLSPQLDPEEVVSFIKQNPKLDKKQIGEFISARKNNNILEAYQKSFNFEGTRIDEALRMYLETFRLPGEAPVISYLLEHFAEHWHKLNKEPFENADAAFTLAYAVIMLNVDQHNFNAKKQNIPMTIENFKKNLSKVNGGKDFDPEMLEEVYQCIKTEEIVMPAEQVGLVRENYLWKVLLRRSFNKDSEYKHVDTGTYDRDLFGIVWGPTVAALSFVFDRSTDNAIVQKTVKGFRKFAMISAHYEMSDVFDNLVISLCKFTTLLSLPESSDALAISFGNNQKAQLAARTVFSLAHRHSDILHDGWKNILECIMQLFKANLLSEVLVKVEDFLDPSGRISLIKEEQSSQNKADSGMLSNLYTFFSMSDSPHPKGPPQEDLDAIKRAQDCILECHVEQLIMDSKFLRDDSLQELLKALIYDSRCSDSLNESGVAGGLVDESHVLRLELLFKVVLQNRDRILTYWAGIEEHLYNTIVAAREYSFLVERAVVGLLRLACRLLRREELSSKVLDSLRILLMSKPGVLYHHLICRHISYGMHDLLKTNASNIHTARDWKVVFTIICVTGASLITYVPSTLHNDHSIDNEVQSDSEVNRAKRGDSDRGYTSDSEVYDGLKPATISSSSSFQALPASDDPAHSTAHSVLNASSSDTLHSAISPRTHPSPNKDSTAAAATDTASADSKARKKSVVKNAFVSDESWFSIYQNSMNKDTSRSKHATTLDHTYNITLNESLGKHDFKAFSKCCETLSFLVRDTAQMTPHNFPTCIHAIRLFVEASVDGGGSHRVHTGGCRGKGHHSKGKSKKEAMMRKSRSSPSHLVASKERLSDEESEDDAYQTISIQLLDLMHTLHTRAATIFKSWSDERSKGVATDEDATVAAATAAATAVGAEKEEGVEEDGEGKSLCEISLWSSCWCPLLQGIARLCCDSRKQVRNQALTYLQRALLVHDLQVLSASEWEDCFSRVLFPLLSQLLQTLSPWDRSGAEETRMRASALLCKVFLQHLTPLLNLPTFTALWLTILDFMDKYMHTDHCDLLSEAIPESLKNMLLVMQTAGILKGEEEPSELWTLTWDRINLFLPRLQKEVFKPHEPEARKHAPLHKEAPGEQEDQPPQPPQQPQTPQTPPQQQQQIYHAHQHSPPQPQQHQQPLQQHQQQQYQQQPQHQQQQHSPLQQFSPPTLLSQQPSQQPHLAYHQSPQAFPPQQSPQPHPTTQPPQLPLPPQTTDDVSTAVQYNATTSPSLPPHHSPIYEYDGTKSKDFMGSIPLPTSHYVLHPPLPSVTDYQPKQGLPLILHQHSLPAGAAPFTPAPSETGSEETASP